MTQHKLYKIVNHMFFTNSVIVDYNLSLEEAEKKCLGWNTGDSYEWETVEEQTNKETEAWKNETIKTHKKAL